MVVSPWKTRIIHDLTFSVSPRTHSVNADTDFEQAPTVVLGRVLRDVIWRILYFLRRFGPRARIVLGKIDVTKAFRQVSVQWGGAPVFTVFMNGSWPTVGCSLGGVVLGGSFVCFRQPSNIFIDTRRTTTPWGWNKGVPRRSMSLSPR